MTEDRYNVIVDSFHPEDESEMTCGQCLKIYLDGNLINYFTDYGEPEDNSFNRDYYWIEKELNKAYQLGLEHGSKSKIIF